MKSIMVAIFLISALAVVLGSTTKSPLKEFCDPNNRDKLSAAVNCLVQKFPDDAPTFGDPKDIPNRLCEKKEKNLRREVAKFLKQNEQGVQEALEAYVEEDTASRPVQP